MISVVLVSSPPLSSPLDLTVAKPEVGRRGVQLAPAPLPALLLRFSPQIWIMLKKTLFWHLLNDKKDFIQGYCDRCQGNCNRGERWGLTLNKARVSRDFQPVTRVRGSADENVLCTDVQVGGLLLNWLSLLLNRHDFCWKRLRCSGIKGGRWGIWSDSGIMSRGVSGNWARFLLIQVYACLVRTGQGPTWRLA